MATKWTLNVLFVVFPFLFIFGLFGILGEEVQDAADKAAHSPIVWLILINVVFKTIIEISRMIQWVF